MASILRMLLIINIIIHQLNGELKINIARVALTELKSMHQKIILISTIFNPRRDNAGACSPDAEIAEIFISIPTQHRDGLLVSFYKLRTAMKLVFSCSQS